MRQRAPNILVVSGLALSLFACSDAEKTTTGRRIILNTKISAGGEARSSFGNAQGWTIRLNKFVLATGALYYFDGATIFSANLPQKNLLERLQEIFAVRSAYAHPGHYIPGDARGEMLTPSSVDLFAGDATLPVGNGVTGTVRSATFSYKTPAEGAFAGDLGAHAVVLEGIATKGADTRNFRAEIDTEDLLNTKNAPAIEGCPFTETDMEANGTVVVSIHLPLWFDQVEFDLVPESTDGKPVLIPAPSIARNELVRGMKVGEGYVFSYSP